MAKDLYAILGVSENATDEEIKASYHFLKKKYSEERFLDGEAGNEAARKLDELDVAYVDLLNQRRESRRDESQGESAYAEVERLLRAGDYHAAQMKLDDFNERTAEWHYLQSVVFYRKSWMNESRKQLEIAMEKDPANAKYRSAYEKLNQNIQNAQNPQNAQYGQGAPNQNAQGSYSYADPDMEQMGGNGCNTAVDCCYTCLCVNCISNICCH